MIVTFFGHADFQRTTEYEQKLLTFLEENVGDRAADMYLGGYGNFDAFAYDRCKQYQQTHPNISLYLITPYITPQYQKNHLEYQKALYDGIIYPEIEDMPPRFAISYRNRWMTDRADLVVCGIDHAFGGAYKTCLYAGRKGKPVFNIIDGGISFEYQRR